MTAPAPFDRILARSVTYQGRHYGLSLVELYDRNVRITPFETETANTRYVNDPIEILPPTPTTRPRILPLPPH